MTDFSKNAAIKVMKKRDLSLASPQLLQLTASSNNNEKNQEVLRNRLELLCCHCAGYHLMVELILTASKAATAIFQNSPVYLQTDHSGCVCSCQL